MAPRTAQKNRTRKELLAAARNLMARGEEVTLAKVAEAAQISRATVYRYFSDPGVLAADAALDISVKDTEELLDGLTDVRERVHAVARYYLEFSRQHDVQFRPYLARTITLPGDAPGVKMRGARRLTAFEQALHPVDGALKRSQIRELAMRLSMTTGIELHIVLADVLKVDDRIGDTLQAGIIDALLDKYLPPGG